MPSNDYFAASYPPPWQILGVDLKPFSLGHYLKLNRLGCAFVSPTIEAATLKDLVLGVLVCSMDSDPDADKDPFWRWMQSDKESPGLWLRNRLAKLLGKKPMAPAEYEVFRWGRKVGDFDFKAKGQLFADYVKWHSDPPGWLDNPDYPRGAPSVAHWSHGVLQMLVSKCGYTLKEAYNVNLRKAWADFYRQAESEGAGQMMTPEQIAFAEAAG